MSAPDPTLDVERLRRFNARASSLAWLGALPYRAELAKQLSPETYVNRTTPPIISVHGDADPTVPYSQKQRLHQALDKAYSPALASVRTKS